MGLVTPAPGGLPPRHHDGVSLGSVLCAPLFSLCTFLRVTSSDPLASVHPSSISSSPDHLAYHLPAIPTSVTQAQHI